MINRSLLKQEAKEAMRGQWFAYVGYVLIFMFIEITAVALTALSFTMTLFSDRFEHFAFAVFLNQSLFISLLVKVLSIFFPIIVIILGLHIYDHTKQSMGREFFSAFSHGKAWSAIANALLNNIFVFFWTLLLIIPGIIKKYSYAMSYYIVEDWGNQGYRSSATEAITASRAMMKGYKWKLFMLDLSFIGWYILSIFTGGLLNFYVIPYHMTTRAAFYRHLIASHANPAQ